MIGAGIVRIIEVQRQYVVDLDRREVPLEVWPESHWPGFALRKADVFQSDIAW